MKKQVVMALVLCVTMALSVFAGGGGQQGKAPSGGAKSLTGGPDTTGPIKVNYVAETRQLKYTQASPLTMPDGTTIKTGDLKPFWQWVEKELNIEFDDVTSQSTASAIIQTESATGFKDANIYGGNSVAADLMTYGSQGYFINLNDYINDEYMPNFKKYLERNGNIKSAITAYDGGIYFLPYIAEVGYYARAFMCRQSWVTALLDGRVTPEAETKTLPVSYQGFWKGANARNSTNAVTLQNAAAANGTLTFSAARTALLNYIKATYPSLQKPSDLYLGSKAQYDIDELIALWRLVRLAPNTLSKVTTGKVVPNADIIPYFFRQTSYREDLLRLANYFNGQRVFGSDSYDARFYLDQKGVLQYSYSESNLLDNVLPLFKAIFNEGLIAPDFATISIKDNFRNIYFGGDIRAGSNKFGFMTFDFIPSTTSVSLGSGKVQTDVEGILPPLTKLPNGVTNGFVHYVENTRVIKPDGWAISAVTGGEKLRQTLKLFDFMFSERGSTAQNFGMPEMIDAQKYIGSGGVAYPKMNKWFNDQAATFSNGDGALFSRNFLGFNFPIGYEKSIGFEQQFTTAEGERTWKLYDDAKVISSTYNKTTSPYFSLVPPVFSLTEQLQRQVLDTNIGSTQVDLIFSYITTNTTGIDQIKQAYASGKIDAYIQAYRDAYALVSK
ncbi:hypothetical protein AGMMS50268_31530 [Spirochaetia bacterium]|nr:hypothetical protein AGMMS50268_31530 [Spirochaetia bacterium]